MPTESKVPRTLTGGVLFLLAALAALGALATNIILPAFPAMSADLGASVRDLGATLSSFFLTFALGQLFVGPLSDRFGRQRLVLIGLAVFIIGSLVCAAASTLPQLIGGRVVQALGVCATSVLSRAIARDLFEGQELARALSLTMVAMAAAPGFSPLLGSTLESLFGWRSSFFVISALAFALAGAYFTKLGETHAPGQRSALSLVEVAAGYKQLAFDRRLTAPALAVSLVIGALYAFFSMAPAILITGFRLSPLTFGLFFASTTFVVFGSGVLAPRLARMWGPVVAARAGVAVALVGSAAMLFGRADFASFSVSLTIFLFGMGIFNPLGTAIALQPFAQQAGAASALLGFLQMGCAALAITFGGMLALPMYTALGVVLFTSLLAAFLCFWSIRVATGT
ncbi:Bcr/CflA family drug resistance efflux transporter [Variovorax sp. WS11]|nr:multidrug effflux MFS transporter [Variovorax sp. WS11]PSL80494.1 Bcr/CflA family drug resistance efflux transporter [Variovorax sp. WS11]